MHFNIKSLLAVGLLTANLLYAGPRVQTGSEQKDQKVVVSGVEVPVDVIVRDKAGRPVKELTAADATGRIQFAGGLPLESIPPGTYDLKAIVTSGGKSVARSARLVIEM